MKKLLSLLCLGACLIILSSCATDEDVRVEDHNRELKNIETGQP